MRRFAVLAILLTACATQPAPSPTPAPAPTAVTATPPAPKPMPAPSPAPAPSVAAVDACDPSIPLADALASNPSADPPRVIRKVTPEVPMYTGTHMVEVEAIIDETGRVTAICSTSGRADLAESTINALRQWTFEPATVDGRPVKVRYKLTTKYQR